MRIASSIFVAAAFAFSLSAQADGEISAHLQVDAGHPGAVIDRHIFGQFAEHLGRGIYEGVWVGEGSPIPNTHGFRLDVLTALKQLRIPVIRWPGGCFADQYHWRDGVGPRKARPTRVNKVWGGVEESNGFGSNEFLALSEMLGADPYLSANVGSGSPEEMTDWLEYLTSPSNSTLANARRHDGHAAPWSIPYVGIGNESWGCGGNMRPEYYADLYRRYASYVPASAQKIASGANADDYRWTEIVMSQIAASAVRPSGLSLHYYTTPRNDWAKKGGATGFGEDEWASSLASASHMEDLIAKHSAIMDRYDPEKKISLAVDEWGVWTDPEPGSNPAFLYQQNSLRDALTAALTLNIFERHADRVRMANIAQMVNVLQAMILTDGAKMVLTPTYDLFKMYVPFQDAVSLPATVAVPAYRHGDVSLPAFDAVAARGKDGKLLLALVNLDPDHPVHIDLAIEAARTAGANGWILTADAIDAHNDFDRPDAIRARPFAAHWKDTAPALDLPAKSVAVVTLTE